MATRSGMLRPAIASARGRVLAGEHQELGAHLAEPGAGKALADALVQRRIVSMTFSGSSAR